MVVDKVKTKLRVVQPLGKVARCQAELPAVACTVGRAARDRRRARRQERRVGRAWRQRRIESRVGDRRHPRRLTLEQAVERIVHVTLHVRLAETAEAQHRKLPARPDKIFRAEVTPRRVNLHLLLFELVKPLQRQVVRRLQRHRHQRHRAHRLAQLRARDAELRHVDRVDDVDAVLDERALAPAQHLVAQADVHRHGRRQVVRDKRIQQLHVPAHLPLGRITQRAVATDVFKVDKVRAAQKQAHILQLLEPQLQVVCALGHTREQARAVVQVGVVAVHGIARAAIGNADGVGLRVRGANRGAVAQGRVEAALDHVVLELHSCGRHSHRGRGRQGQAARHGESTIDSGDWVAHWSGASYHPPARLHAKNETFLPPQLDDPFVP